MTQHAQPNLAGVMWPPADAIPDGENPADFVNYAGLRYRQPEDPDRTPHLDVPSRSNKNLVSMRLCTRTQAPAISATMVLPLQHMLRHTPCSVSERPGMLGAGDAGPDFNIIAKDGSHVSLTDFRGRPLVMMLMRVWKAEMFCPYSIPAIVEMEKAYPEFSRRGVQVALVLPTSRENTLAFTSALGLSYPVYSDPEWSACKSYTRFLGPLPLQGSVILDSSGTVSFIWRSDGGPGGDSLPPMPNGLLKEVIRLFPSQESTNDKF